MEYMVLAAGALAYLGLSSVAHAIRELAHQFRRTNEDRRDG